VHVSDTVKSRFAVKLPQIEVYQQWDSISLELPFTSV
jgi:hypothetical protein